MSEPFFDRDGVTIYRGDSLGVLRSLPDESVQSCVTSPPYWGLRDYGVQGQLGLECRPDCLGWASGSTCSECYVCRLTTVLREVRRVLRRDGTLWLNLGDSYAGYWGARYAHKPFGADRTPDAGTPPNKPSLDFRRTALKPKDLLGMPWRVALALQAQGWYLRSDVIWAKPNPMPESARDRPTCAHEYLFLLSKSARYFFDSEAIKEACVSGPSDRKKMREGRERIGGKHKSLDNSRCKASRHSQIGRKRAVGSPRGRNRRSVWTIPTQPYAGAHFAVFPPALITPCLLAGTSAMGCCAACGAPYRRLVRRTRRSTRPGRDTKVAGHCGSVAGHRDPGRHVTETQTDGWEPACGCGVGRPPEPCVVLDPFLGSGTTAAVAQRLGCRAIGIELNAEYCQLAADRFRQRNLLAATYA